MAAPRLGFVGFGEAGSRIAMGLREAGVEGIWAYDIAADSERVRRRSEESGVRLAATNAELAGRCEVMFSVVTAASAVEAARQNGPHLGAGHTYIDCNSVSPAKKCEIAAVIRAGAGRFVEGAILAPVPKKRGQGVEMLVNGDGAAELLERLAPLGFSMEAVAGAIGTAAGIKMCRSIVVKGLEALLTELVLAASRFGAEERVFASLDQAYPGIEWKKLADYMVNRVAMHGERRAREMEEVAATLRTVGVEPMMSEAAARRQDWAAKLGLAGRFGAEGPSTYREVLEIIESMEKAGGIGVK